ncbi:hypothetical protein A3J20_03320 [Candidatus Gottesmanbacteria bacterium RIFCSPLOWO2_02_FULL_42_29]|uniref:Uncharacterized protein n=1 Tax=Candidatus Gottesmanbacteria bacterium RIFCSPLOWO2_01_FULL_42_22 TaxID=1798391 RepID=A0A1F6BE44_9BACT|nr:MAG: hypothetical protein A2781_04805 [Candidatus Gottesmanbacteria bacterium RIFCSPHIGHO2_01_FULL_42_27]OGG21695.1 MAG: hypothetical protein A3E72_04470 [Candidatus Gottesmanbacteria bacterium RIFCSPHIGHO2_12_FULL_43_26]OGG34234.1 MAG: hypothetical protein A3G68_02935 [Candidatus Gottesmanbacteria bacterium RIFCSPLOWO2_12_FULL_42_10]OGG35032.1 MAG: hypothetical protein A2968_00170 [Candidatus Gottesmanbacteria bacterium RIFCSPLOWO2_01_FULL_42_22]OGG36424.1 MAG: hypothetical protein A3J20_03
MKKTGSTELAFSKTKLIWGTLLGLIFITASLFLRLSGISSKGSDLEHTYKLSNLATPASNSPIETLTAPSVLAP